MAIKEIPINARTYLKSVKAFVTTKHEEATKQREKIESRLYDHYEVVKQYKENYKKEYKLNLDEYDEFVKNTYIDGTLLTTSKGLFTNKKSNYEIVGSLYNLYALAKCQKEIHDVNKELDTYNKVLRLSLNEYNYILKTVYNKIHEEMILNGKGYAFEGSIGWICINRCHLVNPKKVIDYKLTKENKAKLLAEGKRLFNQQEQAWCKDNNLDYKGVDYRIYRNPEYVYEIAYFDCRLPNGRDLKFKCSDYRSRELRGKTNEQIIEECDRDTKKICQLGLDLKTKLTLCNNVDKLLYTKFIRNENQKPSTTSKVDRKNRQ